MVGAPLLYNVLFVKLRALRSCSRRHSPDTTSSTYMVQSFYGSMGPGNGINRPQEAFNMCNGASITSFGVPRVKTSLKPHTTPDI